MSGPAAFLVHVRPTKMGCADVAVSVQARPVKTSYADIAVSVQVRCVYLVARTASMMKHVT